MFRRWLNRAALEIAISPRGPILIKSGQETADPTRPGMEFVRTRHAAYGETVYLPGTSLKGAFRSQAERVLRGLGVDVCDPFHNGSRCRKASRNRTEGTGRKKRSRPPTGAEVFAGQCPACRTFGSLAVAGRCNVEDSYPEGNGVTPDSDATETRWQVGIDRRTGQAKGAALFDLEVVVSGRFLTTIHLENFSLWQLGLVAALLQDMDHGDVPIGFGKSRGLGQVGVELRGLNLETLGRAAGTLAGAGALVAETEAREYDLDPGDVLSLDGDLEPVPTWRGQRLTLSGTQGAQLLERVLDGPLARWVDATAAEGGTP
ncbi:MAG: RAMP superfamily CRISPR-associated protein [Thermoanaerobaculia bacterium]